MRNKSKYNFNNPMILICSLKSTVNEKTNEDMMNYVDKLFYEYNAPKCSYKLYTSTLTKEEAKEKFSNQICPECGTISNKFFPKYVEDYGIISKIVRCEICFQLKPYFNSNKNNFKSSLKCIKYKSTKYFLNKYKKFTKKTRY